MSRLNKNFWTDEQILRVFEPFAKQKGIYLDTKVIITKSDANSVFKYLAIEFDIQSSFEPNECSSLKNFLKRNGFISGGCAVLFRKGEF